MAATQGNTGFGTLLKIGDGASPENFTAIAEVQDISGPNSSWAFAEFTHQESPGNYEEWKPTFLTPGEVTFTCNWLPDNATHDFDTAGGLVKDHIDGTLRNFQLLFPDTGATLASFAAYVANIGPVAPLKDAMRLSVTLRVTGEIEWS